MTPEIYMDLNRSSQNCPDSFEKSFEIILAEISSLFDEKSGSLLEDWIQTVVNYNVPHGKQIRGKMVEMAFKMLSEKANMKQIEDAQVLGWCVEMLQASFLIADDIMDNGTTRRGRPCWYKVGNIGLTAINDSFLLENLVNQIIKRRFGGSKFYIQLLETLTGVTFNTILGQSLDTKFSGNCTPNIKNHPIKKLYDSIATLKTGYYTIYLPIALAMIIAGLDNNEDSKYQCLWNGFEKIALKIGTFFQIQDDYFDCFSDEKKMGKMGSDIQEGKCSWLYVKAMELCATNIKQFNILKECYGSQEPSNILLVKKLYLELDLPTEFMKIKQEMGSDVINLIQSLGHPPLQQVLMNVFNIIFNRVC